MIAAATAPTTDPDASGEGHPAENHRGDAVEGGVGTDAEAGVAGAGDGDGGQPGHGGHGPTDGIGDDLGPPRGHPGEIGGVAIAAGGIEGEAGPGPAHEQGHDDDRDHEHDDGRPEVGARCRSRSR